jgi:membrane dipeptidase
MRYLTLTWNNSTSWASSAMDETRSTIPGYYRNSITDSIRKKGLNEFGRQVVRKLNELGVIVDLSHVGEQTFYDALATTTRPVILSHSSVWNICPVFRNVKDDQIRAVAVNGGVICINFYSGFISKEYARQSEYLNETVKKAFQDSLLAANKDSSFIRSSWREYYRSQMKPLQPTLTQLVDHIDYIVKLVGDDYVGLGSDYDGVSSLPVGMEDASTYPMITKELLRRGYSRNSIKKILGGNLLRVMKENFKG